MSSKWYIVSNRLPFNYDTHRKKIVKSSGGLVTAINGIKTKQKKVWVGTVTENFPESLIKTANTADMSFLSVKVNSELYSSYYNGICNDVLWPLFHYESERVKFHKSHWDSYVEVNQKFADALLKVVKDDDLIWIHDFHLFLLPGMLKKKRKNIKVGFFLHIPFPSSEIYKQLPVREEILRSLIQSDLIGFHDYSYLRHFGSSVYQVLGIQSSLLSIQTDEHNAALGVFPVSIDTKSFATKARTKKVSQLIKHFQMDDKNTKVILGVDRLDYTKGIKQKLIAFRRLLEKHPKLIGKVNFFQIAVPSRTDVDEYIQLRQEIEQLVSEINGQFSTPNYIPIHYVFKSVDFNSLMAIYRSSDVLLVGSKRDGMNLVSLEYIVTQKPSDPGVVVLSEFAGAASTLSHCLKINPWDEEQSSDVLYEALKMPLSKRREAFNNMFSFLESYTATHWAMTFMNSLNNKVVDLEKETKEISSSKEITEIKKKLKNKKKVLFVDYDGTLVEIQKHPHLAVIEKKILTKLKNIKKKNNVEVCIVSGRPSSFMTKQFKGAGFYLASDHGAKFYSPYRKAWQNLINSNKKKWYNQALKLMRDFEARTPQSFIEQKDASLVWHFRNSPREFGMFQARKLIVELEDAMSHLPLNISMGKMIVEVKPVEANKGFFTSWFLRNTKHTEGAIPLCFGDDKTDEDMFMEMKDRGVTIKVGEGFTNAKYRIKEQNLVVPTIEKLL
jgi:trehalose 6-phosphate synthase/phosphatase